ncbi:hypothetical protein [Glutamicibacter ardleyensis]|uniref:Uncharacterized protein n=1 Tax=Glutamicibacter ardleyensis TaxID=225894 RepID=A0ABQ2DFB0_9MICC|nr:hypothetical protein [Glutamicibacter ardleyensis]GGJ55719.1 hypothetical protein GCM10007173_13150 [Glutamicibacter ardleyensis]
MQVIKLPEPVDGLILGIQFRNGVGRTNSPMVASFFAKYKGARLTTPSEVHATMARMFARELVRRES